MNTLVQGAWALALGRQTADGDVVFGMTTAGRPGELPGVEQIVGLCINILPRRVRLDSTARLTDWLRDLQARQAEEQSYDGCSLVDIQRWSSIPTDGVPFDSVVVFENYPVGSSLAADAAASADEIRVSAVASFEQGIDFPLCVVAAPGARMDFRLIFGRRRFDAAAIDRLAGDFVHLLTAFAADPDQRLAALLPEAVRADKSYQPPQSDTTGTPNAASPL
jgi:non-ribosomal peptide synthetase component F